MKDEFVTDLLIRRFLLGEVDDEERQRIEGLFIADPEANQRLLIAEDDLIENYLEDSLTPLECEKFLAQYGNTPSQRRRLRIVKSLREYGLASAGPARAASPPIPKWRMFLSGLKLRNPNFFVPLAAALTIALVVGIVWLVELRNKRAQESNQRVAIERELADLNAPSSARQVTPSIVLPPVSLRSVQSQSEITPGDDTRVVELQLLWAQKERYASYRAVVRRVGKAESFTILNLQVQNEAGRSAVRVRLPTHLLARGLYQISLTGITSDGSPGPAEEYTFAVGG